LFGKIDRATVFSTFHVASLNLDNHPNVRRSYHVANPQTQYLANAKACAAAEDEEGTIPVCKSTVKSGTHRVELLIS
jgi:hypothetical protein